MTGGREPTAWRWRSLPQTPPVRVGASLLGVVAWERLHLVTPRPDGAALLHAAVASTGRQELLPELPLRSLSGLAATPDRLVVAGARRGDDAPVLCLVDEDGTPGKLVEVPHGTPVAAWPVPVAAGGAVLVVWAAGRDEATVWAGELHAERVEARLLLRTGGPLTLQAAACREAVDVLCRGPRLRFARWERAHLEVDEVLDVPASAELVPGAVLSPAAPHAFHVWEPGHGGGWLLALPKPPEGGSARARRPRVVSAAGQPDLLAWVTEVPDDLGGGVPGEVRVHVLTSRTWLAPLDRGAWTVGPAAEVPVAGPPDTVTWLGGSIAVVGSGRGLASVVLGQPG